jgi:hypothetical protein
MGRFDNGSVELPAQARFERDATGTGDIHRPQAQP